MTPADLKIKCSEIGLGSEFSDRELARYQEDLSFLFRTRLMYSIVGYQNSTTTGPSVHAIRRDDSGLYIKVRGIFTSVHSLEQDYDFDPEEHHLALKTDKKTHWNYFSPNGLVPIDRYLHHEWLTEEQVDRRYHLQPIEQLDPDEMDRIRALAARYFGPDANPQMNRPCVLQLVTNPRGIKEQGCGRRWRTQYPVHAYVRLIDAWGRVYSTGFGSTLDEDEYNKGMSRYLASINGQPTIMDYEEMRRHEGRIVTSVPVSLEALDRLLTTLGDLRRQTTRFNLLRQNCLTMAAYAMKVGAGIDLNITVPIHAVFGRIVGVRSLPQIAPAWEPEKAKALAERVAHKATRERRTRVAIAIASLGITELYRIIRESVYVGIVRSLGGKQGSPLREHETQAEDEQLEQFYSVIPARSIDMVKEGTSLYHSYPLIQWQLAQASTFVQPYTGVPKMGLYPPFTSAELAEGARLRNKLHKAFCVLAPDSWPGERKASI